ncbi:MAG: DsrE family protein [Cyclobacteriaceae bacterium]|nr:DsrE family protein [Cyclobacteriaceae bacterium]
MKASIILVLILFTTGLFAQTSEVIDLKRHKIVMQFNNGDSLSQASVLGQVGNIRAAWPNAQIEVVCHGPGLDLLIAQKSKVPTQLTEWSSKGVIFAACNNTMKRRNISTKDLLQAATVVPSAMIELTRKQENKWAYVKGGH